MKISEVKNETKADHVGTVRVHELAVVSMIDCTGPIDVTA